jgi:hypothetical protein
MNRRELFGVTAGAVAAACLPSMPVPNDFDYFDVPNRLPPDFIRWRISPGTLFHLGPGDSITALSIDFSDPADVKFVMTESEQA